MVEPGARIDPFGAQRKLCRGGTTRQSLDHDQYFQFLLASHAASLEMPCFGWFGTVAPVVTLQVRVALEGYPSLCHCERESLAWIYVLLLIEFSITFDSERALCMCTRKQYSLSIASSRTYHTLLKICIEEKGNVQYSSRILPMCQPVLRTVVRCENTVCTRTAEDICCRMNHDTVKYLVYFTCSLTVHLCIGDVPCWTPCKQDRAQYHTVNSTSCPVS